jgi:hypothetical protein
MENFEKGEEQGSEELLYGCNGGEFVFCPAAKKNSENASLMVFKVPVNRASP